MKLITIANFPNEQNYHDLEEWWINQALKNIPLGVPIEMWTDKLEPGQRIPYNDFTLIGKEYFDISHVRPGDNKAFHNIGFKLYNLCNETEPFIFVDLDAIIFQPLLHLIECSKDQPVIMVNHQRVPGHTDHIPFPFLNSGVQVVSDPSILDFDYMMNMWKKNGFNFVVPGTDQALLFQYFNEIKYDYTHHQVGYEWNNCANIRSNLWQCRTDGELVPVMKDDVIRPVCINHYWYNFKPWQINCPMFDTFTRREIDE